MEKHITISLRLPLYMTFIYQEKARKHHTTMTFEINQALMRDIEAGAEKSKEEIEEEFIERDEQTVLDCIQQIQAKGYDPNLRDIMRYRPRFTKEELVQITSRLTAQGRIAQYTSGKTYRFTLPE